MRRLAFSAFPSADSSPTKFGVDPWAIALRYAYIFDQTLSRDNPEKAEYLAQIGGSALRTEGRDEVVTHSERSG